MGHFKIISQVAVAWTNSKGKSILVNH